MDVTRFETDEVEVAPRNVAGLDRAVAQLGQARPILSPSAQPMPKDYSSMPRKRSLQSRPVDRVVRKLQTAICQTEWLFRR